MTRIARETRRLVQLATAAIVAIAFVSGGAAAQASGRGDRGEGATQPKRERMERDFEERMNRLIRDRLALNDEQFKQLRAVSTRLETDRRALRREESDARVALRRELLATGPANETRIAELMEQLPRLDRRRIDLQEQEQRELAKFLAPSQRARFFALQDDLRRNLQELQRRRMDHGDSTDANRGGPPGGRRGGLVRPPSR